MKILILLLLLVPIFSINPLNNDFVCGNSVISISGSMPSNIQSIKGVTGIPVGGREITNQGILRVLVIFIRFKDDYTNTQTWPDYNELPSWAENIIDDQIPANNTYTPGSISDFMDRASGGDGAGNLGIFKVIGDIYYVTTDENESYYGGYSAINNHVLTKLNTQIDYSLYDNWKFMKNGEYYNHEYLPDAGDGEVDYVMFFNRKDYYNPTVAGYKGYLIPSNFYLDGRLFNGYGSTHFGYRNKGNSKVTITIPIHEFTHYLFGGNNNTDGHLDGRVVYGNQLNIGNVAWFAMMLSSAGDNSFYSGYERYRAGWLNPTVLNNSQSSLFLQDTHKKHKAFLIPIRQDAIDPTITAEYYLIENYQTVNSYSSANPFLTTSVFNYTFDHGLLVFHIEQDDYNIATNSNLDIESADGLWNFHLTSGTSTPSTREDDVLNKNTTSRISGFDERDAITVTVGSITYNDYYCLTTLSCGTSCPPNHGRRYYEDAYLGDNDDFFRNDRVKVFSSWSNPQLCLASGTSIYMGFEIKNYYSNIREYEISYQSGYADVLSLSPSKPQNFNVDAVNGFAQLTWEQNIEPDMQYSGKYKIYSASTSGGAPTQFYYKRTIDAYNGTTPVTSWTDPDPWVGQGSLKLFYRITAVDNGSQESVPSDYDWVPWGGYYQKQGHTNEIVISDYKLYNNYPNPFNPTTTIYYDVKDRGLVSLSVYDILGKEVANLVNEIKDAGRYSVSLDASDLPSGVYVYTLRVNDFMASKKIVVLK